MKEWLREWLSQLISLVFRARSDRVLKSETSIPLSGVKVFTCTMEGGIGGTDLL